MVQGLVTVFGGSGFLGRHLVKRLAAAGAQVRVAVRDPDRGLFLRPMGHVGQISLAQANVRNTDSVRAAVRGADAVVYLVGVLAEHGRQTYAALHAEGAGRAAQAAAEAGARRFVLVSALGADAGAPSRYARTKAEGEQRVRGAFAGPVIVRPSVVFGPEDTFFNRFGALARLLPLLPLFGGGDGPRLQPVYVSDVAEALAAALARGDTKGMTFELGGPEVMTLREVYERVLAWTGRRGWIVPLPKFFGTLQAIASAVLPMPAMLRISRDELRQLSTDNVVSPGAKGLGELGVAPTPASMVVPEMLECYARPGRVPLAQS